MTLGEAAARQFHKHFEDITECCICTETYKDPRILPCIHTFCLSCLQTVGLKSAKKPGERIPCPICRKEFTIPGDGFIGTQKNFFMTKLIEISKAFNQSATTTKCDACLKDSNPGSTTEVPLAEIFCKDCCMSLCNSCSKVHGNSKLTKTHKLISVESETSKEKLINDLMPEMCPKHVEERLKIYCSDCKDTVCAFCYIGSHQNHNWLEVDKAAEEFRQQILVNIHSLQSHSLKTSEKKKALEVAKTETMEKVKLLEQSVTGRTNELKALIDKHSQSLLAELEVIKQRRLKEIKKQIEDIDEEIMNLDSYAMYCDEMMKRASSSNICRTASDLITRCFDLKKTQEFIIKQEISPFNFCIDLSSSDAFLKDNERNSIGRLNCSLDLRSDIFRNNRTSVEGFLGNEHSYPNNCRTNRKETQQDGSEKFTFFCGSVSPFCQWHRCSFVVDGQQYNCAEQYMMHQKALTFKDTATAHQILKTSSPVKQKSLGREVTNFDSNCWNSISRKVVKKGNLAKFEQNEDLKKRLFATAGTTLAEASPNETLWGIGLAEDDPRAKCRKTWRGKNWLGEVLTDVREELMHRDSKA